ncbi:hypothetical protein AB0E83_25695 [Streptomyces sp. NPDC035033]|uniref:hypothetical protein n=1 Tax=Streptomyces sp. NPDC035033 TaxID=3155368 RepID=UPI0033EEF6C3
MPSNPAAARGESPPLARARRTQGWGLGLLAAAGLLPALLGGSVPCAALGSALCASGGARRRPAEHLDGTAGA